MLDVESLETAVMGAVDKVGKPSWRSPTWWLSSVAPAFLPVVLMLFGIMPTAPVAIVCTTALLAIVSIVGHLSDGWLKTALAAAPDLWRLVSQIHTWKTGGELAALRPAPYSSTAPAQVFVDTATKVTQVADADEPRGGRGDK